jgi:hypothetical protein
MTDPTPTAEDRAAAQAVWDAFWPGGNCGEPPAEGLTWERIAEIMASHRPKPTAVDDETHHDEAAEEMVRLISFWVAEGQSYTDMKPQVKRWLRTHYGPLREYAEPAVDDEMHGRVASIIGNGIDTNSSITDEEIEDTLRTHYGPLVERVRIAEHALSEFKKDRERTERAFYESAKSERDALQTEVERLKGEVTGTSERNKELHFYSAQLSSDLADARRRLDGLQDTSRTIRLMFDDGTFTRNTSGDHEKGWALRAIKITKAIGDWCDAMDATEPEDGEGGG